VPPTPPIDPDCSMEHEPGSFRDRSNQVFVGEEGVFRGLRGDAVKDYEKLKQTVFFSHLMDRGSIVSTSDCSIDVLKAPHATATFELAIQHERVPFVSYPYEWSFSMLKDAALLQPELLERALAEDMIVKDSSSFNVQWVKGRPVFIDIGSFERHTPSSPWAGYRQFCALFLYPLMLQSLKGVDFQPWLRGALDGFEPNVFAKLFSFRDWFRPGVFKHVVLHSMARSRYNNSKSNASQDMAAAGFHRELILANVRGLAKLVRKLSWKPRSSTWSDYTITSSYTDRELAEKVEFVERATLAAPRSLIWDMGANTGTFSKLAAKTGAHVVSFDADHLAVEELYLDLKRSGNGPSILPLVHNVANPSPRQGWRHLERGCLEDRGKPDLVLCLALIHHVVISSNVPLGSFVEWLASFKADLVIEFVTRQDEMVETLLRNRPDVFADYSLDNFERTLKQHFRICDKRDLKGGKRRIFHAVSRSCRPPIVS